MEWDKKVIVSICIPIILLASLFWQVEIVRAEGDEEGRATTIVVSYTEYRWWLISWDEHKVYCTVYADHEGVPNEEEVIRDCGEEIGYIWRYTPACEIDEEEEGNVTAGCRGFYFQLVSSQPAEKEVVVDLPEATVWVDMEGCDPAPPTNFCPEIPSLLLIGAEPLPNEEITAVHGLYDGEPFMCPESSCAVPLRATPVLGAEIEFWAESSFGDTSDHYTAQVRVIDTGANPAPGGSGWYVDVISTQWVGNPLVSCAKIWQSFPPIGGPPDWLKTPEDDKLIATEEPYYYLAGRLISQGLVDVSECVSGGLLPNGYADVCGLEKASLVLEKWQNQFDARIIEVAQETGIPAQLIKNLFAQESQFWPGVYRVPFEFGLGQLTDKGADSILLWNNSFYEQFCPLVLAAETCDQGYLSLPKGEQAILRGAVALQAKADCADCLTGIDLTQTNFSVSLFANTLLASCTQVDQTIANATGETSGAVSTYEDLWRYTIANYHAGAGCLAYAIHQAWLNEGLLNWEVVKKYFTEPCQGVIPYVEKITDGDGQFSLLLPESIP